MKVVGLTKKDGGESSAAPLLPSLYVRDFEPQARFAHSQSSAISIFNSALIT